MFLLLFLLFPFIEIFLFYQAIVNWGLLNTIALVILSFAAGLFISMWVGRSVLMTIQLELARGRMPVRKVLNKAVLLLAALLLMIPGIGTDIVAILLIVPGLRHVLVIAIEAKLKLALARGSVRVFNSFGSFGKTGFTYRQESQQVYPEQDFPESQMREVREAQVIDVTPLIEEKRNRKED